MALGLSAYGKNSLVLRQLIEERKRGWSSYCLPGEFGTSNFEEHKLFPKNESKLKNFKGSKILIPKVSFHFARPIFENNYNR